MITGDETRFDWLRIRLASFILGHKLWDQVHNLWIEEGRRRQLGEPVGIYYNGQIITAGMLKIRTAEMPDIGSLVVNRDSRESPNVV